MKKLLLSLFVILAVSSCTVDQIESFKEETNPQSSSAAPIVFNLQAKHPDAGTKAVKAGWENGDAIFVFFSGAKAPKFLKMTYNGTEWTTAEYDGNTATPGALGLKNGDAGTMRAVFLPFGSNATVSANGTNFVFNKTYYAYYLTATLEYTVTSNTISGAFEMTIPDNYVQFFVEDASAVDEAYTLGCDAVIPVGVASISSDGTVNETTDKTAAHDMPGYAYSGGYLFSGKLTSWSYGSNYYFAKKKTSDNSRADYFVTGKTLSSHSSVKLPANNDSKWQAVGSDKLVQLTYDGSDSNLWWNTCNYGQSVPEAVGTLYTFNAANSLEVSLPTKEQFESIINNCSYTWLTIHGKQGAVVKAAQGFLFLPAHDDNSGGYWSSTEGGDSKAWYFYFSGLAHNTSTAVDDSSYPVRPVTLVINLSTCSSAVTIPSGAAAKVTGSKSDCVVTVEGGGSNITLEDASMHCLVIQGDATVVVKGENQLKTNGSSSIQAKGAVTFRGNGSLTTYSLSGTGGEYADIKFESGTYDFQRYGITAKSINVTGGNITSQGEKDYSVTAIKASDSIVISGGEVNATGDLIGLYVSAGNLTISGGIVNAEQTRGFNPNTDKYALAGIAVNGGWLTISGGTVVATGNFGSGIGGRGGWAGNLPATTTGIRISGGDVTAKSNGSASAIGFAGQGNKHGPHCGDGGITVTKDISSLKLVSTAAAMIQTNNTDSTCKITVDGVENPTASSTFEHLNLTVSTTTNENDTWTFTPKQ
ncbi:MAG: hypothetical protein IKX11_02850 [Bacteroidales bacterium]|nr:hypothetical protein [Bacteroidales bacterium]